MTDFYGRPLRNNGAPASPGYFDSSTSDNYYPDPRESNTLPRREDTPNGPRRSPTMNDDRNISPTRSTASDGVSPDLIAAIAEKVKKELLEQLHQTGSMDDRSRAQQPTPPAQPMQRERSNHSNSTSSPPPTARRVYTPPSPTLPTKNYMPQPSMPQAPESMRSPPPESPMEKSGVRFSNREHTTRPVVGGRTYSTTELSTIDQKWGRLFDSGGNPTTRLGDILRGLANHIIDDFSPKKSIVVTPKKMSTYYDTHAVDKEPHPLLLIFRSQQYESISRLYQDLGCQHHLIQEDASAAPIIPSLTPVGFAQWMTITILAYPDEESQRLAKVFLASPVDADGALVDGKPERLPKQISRYLLPSKYDSRMRKIFDDAIASYLNDLGSTNRRKDSIKGPPLSRHSSTSQPKARPVPVEVHQSNTVPTTIKPLERQRNPYSGNQARSDTSNSEDATTPGAIKIERERQPYTAKEGSGKVYAAENVNNPSQCTSSRPRRSGSVNNKQRPQPENTEPPIGGRQQRAQSNATTAGYVPPSSRSRRPSSPPLKSFSRSVPDISTPSSYGIDSGFGTSSRFPPDLSSSSNNFGSSSPFKPGSYPNPNPSPFPPPSTGPPPTDTSHRTRDERQYHRGGDDDNHYSGDFTSPRDAEKWDRYQDLREEELDRPFERPHSIAVEPRDTRGAPPDDWYRDSRSRPSNLDTYGAGRRY